MNGEDRVGADVGHHVHPQRGDRAVGLHRGLQVGHLVAAVGGGDHVLDARLRPAHRDAVDSARAPPAGRPRGRGRTSRRSRRPPRGRSRGSGSPACAGRWPGRRAGCAAPGAGPHDEPAGGRGRGRPGRPRASIGMPESRWLTMRCLTTRWALAKAASASPALILFCVLDILGRVVEEQGGARRPWPRTASATAGRGSQSTRTSAGRVGGDASGSRDHGGHRLAHVADAAHRQRVVWRPILALGGPAALGRAAADRQRLDAVRADVLAGEDQRAPRGGAAPPRCRCRGCAAWA